MGQMRLESVEIAGFKSFCDKQELTFKGGITGVVGPNGCGKSNISDAINWVLGEQSAKSLRGTSMDDVIFNGSAVRQPLQMAEVNLKVSGLNGNSPDGAPECVVSRRLYRNGESEYLMNGAVCRLRDIHELSYQEIASQLGVAEGTVKSRINRGRAELAKQIEALRKEKGV